MTFLGEYNNPIIPGWRSPLRWFYVSIKRDNKGAPVFEVPTSDFFKKRPDGANPSRGNPHTPWHKIEEHIDLTHAHIYAESEEHAKTRAKTLYEQEFP